MLIGASADKPNLSIFILDALLDAFETAPTFWNGSFGF